MGQLVAEPPVAPVRALTLAWPLYRPSSLLAPAPRLHLVSFSSLVHLLCLHSSRFGCFAFRLHHSLALPSPSKSTPYSVTVIPPSLSSCRLLPPFLFFRSAVPRLGLPLWRDPREECADVSLGRPRCVITAVVVGAPCVPDPREGRDGLRLCGIQTR